ncbi:MAG: ParA family protein [Raoultibacter sp.]
MDSEAKEAGKAGGAQGLFPLNPITVIVGHYGVGKTNLSLNLALDATARGQRVTLIDLDVVNPYFRSSEYAAVLDQAGVCLISPVFAGSTLDSPSVSGKVSAAIDNAARACAPTAPTAPAAPAPADCLIIDAGGDDVGATALGRFASQIAACPYALFYVINAYRNLTQQPADAAAVLAEIQAKSQLRATGIINNSHLQSETTQRTILDAEAFATTTAALLGLPLVCTTVPNSLVERKNSPFSCGDDSQNVYPVKVLVRAPW